MKPLAILVGLAFAIPLQAEEPAVLLKPDAFQTLVNPNCSHCIDEAKARAGELKPDDRVLAWTRGKYSGGAIPIRFFLNSYRVISDSYGTFVHDPDAGFSRGFRASYDYQFAGWRNGVMAVKHKDGTLFSALSGKAFDGPRKGERMETWPTVVTDWSWVMKEYPNGVAYKMFEKYRPVESPTKPTADSVSTRGKVDKRMPADELVLGIDKPNEQSKPRAFSLKQFAGSPDGYALIGDKFECCVEIAVFWHGPTKTAAAYEPVAEKREETRSLGIEGKKLDERAVELVLDAKPNSAPYRDRKTESRFDLAGRCVEGSLKDWTLRPLDAVVVKWFAWAAEFPDTTIYSAKKESKTEKADDGKTEATIKELAGTAEFLRAIPKKVATLKTVDAKNRTVSLAIDGEKEEKVWALTPDAEVKVSGWWGRLDDLKVGERVWVWFSTDRKKQPREVFMICDAVTEKEIHAANSPNDSLEAERLRQRKKLVERWLAEGLPATVGHVQTYSGEADFYFDHETMAWARTLKPGDKVRIPAEPPIAAVVKSVAPAREKTLVRLVINGLDISEIRTGQRINVLVPKPSDELLNSPYPPGIDDNRDRAAQIDWFLANMYCVCGVKGNTCTGHFYTLASCNPNGCAAPNATRKLLGEMIDKGMANRHIYDELLKARGKRMTEPHLLP